MNDIYSDQHPKLVEDLLSKLKTGTEYIGDLIQVSKMLKEQNDDRLEDRDKYYGDIAKAKADAEVSMGREVLSLALAGSQSTLAVLEGVAHDVLSAARVGAHSFEAREEVDRRRSSWMRSNSLNDRRRPNDQYARLARTLLGLG